MDEGREIVRDHRGRPFMTCVACGAPLRKEDFWNAGLRLPEYGETAEEYCDAELLDDLRHAACLSAATRAAS
ncbi:MAG TPA: hypothetical protein VNN12_07890 [Dehalococcoidia bacterium]|nr:hypothetical protein [Dehalococcoidia bacterium]